MADDPINLVSRYAEMTKDEREMIVDTFKYLQTVPYSIPEWARRLPEMHEGLIPFLSYCKMKDFFETNSINPIDEKWEKHRKAHVSLNKKWGWKFDTVALDTYEELGGKRR